MKLRDNKREDPGVNLTPLIDVVFLLLIFFMVSTSFSRNSELVVDLPEAEATPLESKDEVIEVTIDREGRFYVNQQQLINTQISTVRRAMRLAMEGKNDPSLIISADRMTPHQAVVTAMDAARQLNLINVSIATKDNRTE